MLKFQIRVQKTIPCRSSCNFSWVSPKQPWLPWSVFVCLFGALFFNESPYDLVNLNPHSNTSDNTLNISTVDLGIPNCKMCPETIALFL